MTCEKKWLSVIGIGEDGLAGLSAIAPDGFLAIGVSGHPDFKQLMI